MLATGLAAARHAAFVTTLASRGQAAAVLGAELAGRNVDLLAVDRAYGQLLAGLRGGRYVVVPWQVQGEGGALGAVQLGIAQAGNSNLGQWAALVPVIVRVAVQVVAGVGAWVIANAWTHAKELEAKAEQTRADTQAKVSAAVTSLAATDPSAANALADALTRANNAAAGIQPGALDRIIDMLEGGARGASSFFENNLLLIIALGLWAMSRRHS
jgi:hypothetical protein